ncbi:MAG: hypothetical protein M5U26_03550 [Planctomycetota bacterium]|nr:hypothetical protein [Planctomycetota bacterium]
MQLILQLGLPGGLVVWFVWRNDKREQALSRRLDDVQDFVRSELGKLAHEANEARIIEANAKDSHTRALARQTGSIEALARATELHAQQIGRIQCLQTPPHGVRAVGQQGD